MTAFIRLLYAVLIALTVVAFVGVGIFSFYQPPKSPDYSSVGDSSDADYQNSQKAYDKADKAYQSNAKVYQRNVTYVLLPLVVVSLGAGLYLLRRSEVIGEGLALGGVGISIYAIITASIADHRALRFIAVTLLLASVLLTANYRFSTKRPRHTG